MSYSIINLTYYQRKALEFIEKCHKSDLPAMAHCFWENDALVDMGLAYREEFRIDGRFIYNCIRPLAAGERFKAEGKGKQ